MLFRSVGMGLYIAILKHALPINALKTSIQLNMISVLPYTLGQMMGSMIVLGLIGIITISVFSTFISSISSKTSVAMMITVLILIGGFILAMQMDLNNPVLEWIHLLLPGSLMISYSKFYSIPIITILGNVILTFKASLLIGVLSIVIFLGLASWKYVRR